MRTTTHTLLDVFLQSESCCTTSKMSSVQYSLSSAIALANFSRHDAPTVCLMKFLAVSARMNTRLIKMCVFGDRGFEEVENFSHDSCTEIEKMEYFLTCIEEDEQMFEELKQIVSRSPIFSSRWKTLSSYSLVQKLWERAAQVSAVFQAREKDADDLFKNSKLERA